jgi:hypothetical protein
MEDDTARRVDIPHFCRQKPSFARNIKNSA